MRGTLSYREVELVWFLCVRVSVHSRQCEKRVIGSPVPGCRLMGRWREWKPDGKSEGREEMDEQTRKDFTSLSVGLSGTKQYKAEEHQMCKAKKKNTFSYQLNTFFLKVQKIGKREMSDF